ncbi:hypothetical protein WDV93_20860 [Pantoea ananatis]
MTAAAYFDALYAQRNRKPSNAGGKKQRVHISKQTSFSILPGFTP